MGTIRRLAQYDTDMAMRSINYSGDHAQIWDLEVLILTRLSFEKGEIIFYCVHA